MSRWRLFRILMWGAILVLTAAWLILGILPQVRALRQVNVRSRVLGEELNTLTVAGADVAPLEKAERALQSDLDQEWGRAFPPEPAAELGLWETQARIWGDLGRSAGLDHLVLSLRTGDEVLNASPIWVGQKEGLKELLDRLTRQVGTSSRGRRPESDFGKGLGEGHDLQEVRLAGTGSLDAWAGLLRGVVERQMPYLRIRSFQLFSGTGPAGVLTLEVFAGHLREGSDG